MPTKVLTHTALNITYRKRLSARNLETESAAIKDTDCEKVRQDDTEMRHTAGQFRENLPQLSAQCTAV